MWLAVLIEIIVGLRGFLQANAQKTPLATTLLLLRA
jgi:hypothetical protein